MVALDRCKAVESFDCYDPENLERVAELCRGAAMVIEERPYAGWPAHQPIAAKILAAEPDLTAICISPFGLSGPHAHYAAAPLNPTTAPATRNRFPVTHFGRNIKPDPPSKRGGTGENRRLDCWRQWLLWLLSPGTVTGKDTSLTARNKKRSYRCTGQIWLSIPTAADC